MSLSTVWRCVNRDAPCPICGKADWCAVSAGGQLVRCQRVELGAHKVGTDKNGQTYYLHRLSGEQRPPVELPRRPSGPTVERADAGTLHSIYDALLGQLHLSAAHREQLRRRGLPDAEIDRRLYRSLPVHGRARLARQLGERFGAELLLSVPGFATKAKDGKRWLTIAGAAGLLVPVRDAAGRIVALKVRRDDAGDGPRYSYLSSAKYSGAGPGSPVHVPLGVAAPAMTVRLTEGELKADIAYLLSGTPTISIPGVASWKAAIPVLQRLGTKIVLMAFDADASKKPPVARALSACVEGLAAEGLSVEVERWDAAHKGIDDALAAGVAVEVLTGDAARAYVAEVLALATAGEPPPPPGPLGRFDAVLSEGGAEGLYRDAELLKALAGLAENDPAEFACKRGRLKAAGIALRDFDRALAPIRQALRAERPPLTSAGEYRVSGGRTVHVRPTKDGPVEAPLCNFSARIVEQTTVDDGAERSIRLSVEGQLHDGTPLPRVEIAAEKFGWMEWVIPSWGTRAVVNAGMGTRDHLRCAVQLLSGDVPQQTVYGHLGWRKIGERWLYLHAGGALGADGPVDGVDVSPPDALARYVLPAPPAGGDLCRAVRASLALLGLAADRTVFPLLAAVYRAILGGADFAVHLAGPTGVFKTELAALLQQHFGAEMDARHLPASWASTGNSLESIAFCAKDALLVVDDLSPSGSAADVARYHREAERLLRAQGNAAGRQRMRADGSLRPARPPRGLILSTGEDVPRGQSLRARLLAIDVERGDIDAGRLTACQCDAAAGRYAEALAGFLRWLAPQYDAVRGRLSAERAEVRERSADDGQHARTPGIVADLALGLRYLLDFAAASGAVSRTERAALWDRGWAALRQAGDAQTEHIECAEPTGHFLRLLSAAVASGRAHLAAADGGHPETPSAWGWRREDANYGPTWRPQGKRIGWIDGAALLLEPEASYAAAQALASEQGESLAITTRALWKRLRERGLLASWDERRQRNTVRRDLEGVRHREVLHLRIGVLSATEPSTPSTRDDSPMKTKGFVDGFGGRSDESPPQPSTGPSTTTIHETTGNGAGSASCGRCGRSDSGGDGPAPDISADWFAEGQTWESTRTPWDGDSPAAAPRPTVDPSPSERQGGRRRQGDASEPDLFGKG